MGRGSRVHDKRLGVTDISQVREDLKIIDEFSRCIKAILEFDGEDGACALWQVFQLQLVVRGRCKARIVDFSDLRVLFKKFCDSSALVKMYLKGDFGADPGDVNPYAASLFYAVDRFASYRMKWKDFYEKGGIIIADRYTTSNMVHQMTKYDDEEERTQFLSWLEKTEYEELELPRPDLVILLDIPLRMSEALVKARAAEGGSMDIHEQHLDYLRKCHNAYQALVRFYGWERIPCAREGVLRSVTDIGRDVDAAVEKVMKNRK